MDEYELQDSYFFLLDSPFLMIAGVALLGIAVYILVRKRKKVN